MNIRGLPDTIKFDLRNELPSKLGEVLVDIAGNCWEVSAINHEALTFTAELIESRGLDVILSRNDLLDGRYKIWKNPYNTVKAKLLYLQNDPSRKMRNIFGQMTPQEEEETWKKARDEALRKKLNGE